MKKGSFLRRIPFTQLGVISRHTLTNDAMFARAMVSCGWGCDDEQDNAPIGSSTNSPKAPGRLRWKSARSEKSGRIVTYPTTARGIEACAFSWLAPGPLADISAAGCCKPA